MNTENKDLIPELQNEMTDHHEPPNLFHQTGNVRRNFSKLRRFFIFAGILTLLAVCIRIDLPVTGTAHVVPSQQLTVEALEDGIVENINFTSGETVAAGDVVATLRNDAIVKDLEEAKLKMEITRKKLLQIDRSRNYQRIVFNTYEELYKDNVIARSELEKVKLDYTHSLQEYDIYKDEMEGLRAKINYYQKAFRNMKIYAPISGIILTKIENKLGTFVKIGDELCQIGDMNEYLLELPINEKFIHSFSIGDKATIRFPAFPHQPVKAHVVKVQHMAWEKMKKILVKESVLTVLIEPTERELPVKPQMTAQVKIHSGKIRFRWQR